ncbi:hypothetical protein GAYE_SCF53G6179 [Galdieria yellowstonensis]|uniref:Uricase n=1 Tax=Galdieria yellowstonensis TaxID=3028027 RepID=A0AAV9ILL9_9RHOD|nr:hypothetical protein GAYE_SCF53G6179 [Galdieria yellowstonensis]
MVATPFMGPLTDLVAFCEMATLLHSSHGKAKVRVAKAKRGPGRYTELFQEFVVQVSLEGGTESSFLRGDNSQVVATDTCKNIVYWVVKHHPCDSVEKLAMDIGCFFLAHYAFVKCSQVRVERLPWSRANLHGKSHSHGFVRQAEEYNFASVTCTRVAKQNEVPPYTNTFGCFDHSLYAILLTSGVDKWKLLKTTCSGWEGFYRDQFTTLPETNERILATECQISWTYSSRQYAELGKLDFPKVLSQVQDIVRQRFFGDSTNGVYSPGVQKTLFDIGAQILMSCPLLENVSLSMPNIHYLPANLEVFSKNGVRFENDVLPCKIVKKRKRANISHK